MQSESPNKRLRRLAIALLLSVFVCVARVLSGTLWGQFPRIGIASWAYLVVAAFALGHAMFSIGEMLRTHNAGAAALTTRKIQRRLIQGAWLVVAYFAVMTWPKGTYPPYSTASLLVVIIVFGLPLAVAESPLSSKRLLRIVDKYPTLLTAAVIGVMITATISFLLKARPSIGGTDFFHFVVCARDNEPDYSYFPGMYVFWKTAIRSTGGSIDALQWCYLGALVANAGLIVAIVARVSRSYFAAIYAGIWYLVLCSRWQGFIGATEPIATVFFLLGLLIWAGKPLQGKAGLVSAIAMGIGLGFTLFCKQPGGLMSLGALSLLVNYLMVRGSRRHTFKQMALIPVVALISVAVAFALEGEGMRPLQTGLNLVHEYQPIGSVFSNLNVLALRDETTPYVGGLVLIAFIAVVLCNRRWQFFGEPSCELVGFCVIAGLATLTQFQRRAYAHYALLTVPVFVIAGVLLWMRIVPWLVRHSPNRRLVWFFLAMLALFPMLDLDGNHESLHVWQLRNPHWQTIWHNQPEITNDLDQLKKLVPAGSKMLIVPSRCNSPRYLLNTRSIHVTGYAYDSPEVSEIAWSQYDCVLMIEAEFAGPLERQPWPDSKLRDVKQMLDEFAFEKERELKTMSLYRR